jgi:hypothetical protein
VRRVAVKVLSTSSATEMSGSQTTNVKLRLIAEQLVEDLAMVGRHQGGALRSACNELMFSVQKRAGDRNHSALGTG